MKAEQIFELALQYGAEQPGITFDSEALLRYTRKVQEMEREACAKLAEETVCATHLPTGVNIYGSRAAKAIRERSNP
jgi:DNA-directed RNA polymerase subunit F